jgi:hypothetical protein
VERGIDGGRRGGGPDVVPVLTAVKPAPRSHDSTWPAWPAVAPARSTDVTLSPRNTTAPANAKTGIRLSTTAACVAATREITVLNSRKLTP